MGHHGMAGKPGRRAFFWYAPAKTRFSTLSPVTRVFIGLFLGVFAYFVPLIIDLVLLASALILLHLAEVNWKSMKFVFIANVIMLPSMLASWAVFGKPNAPTVLWEWWFIRVALENLVAGFTFWIRLIVGIYGTLFVLTVCTDDDLLMCLRVIRVPHFLSMIVATSFRSIQTFFDDIMMIMEAQKSRGLNFNKLPLRGKLRWFIALAVPLFVLEFRKMEEMTNAAEARGYAPFGGKKRTDFKLGEAKLHRPDYVIVGILVALLLLSVLTSFGLLP